MTAHQRRGRRHSGLQLEPEETGGSRLALWGFHGFLLILFVAGAWLLLLQIQGSADTGPQGEPSPAAREAHEPPEGTTPPLAAEQTVEPSPLPDLPI